jgi:hypothetical protein
MTNEDFDDFLADAEVIHSYTRAQAIADGVLVDLSQHPMAVELGYRYPVACTSTVYNRLIDLTPAAKRACNDVDGRLWDVLYMLRLAIRRAPEDAEVLYFEVRAVSQRLRPTPFRLKCVCGPGDSGEPVLTVMFPDED